MKINDLAVVLEGGANRGVFTAGVLDYLMEKDVYPGYTVGVSAGACNAVDYVSGQIGRTRDCFITYEKDERYMNFRNFFKGKPIYDMDKVFEEFPMHQHPFDFDSFFGSDIICEMVVTNCVTGQAEYLRAPKGDPDSFMKICKASCSMPLFEPIVVYDHKAYLDGGVGDSVPIHRASELGYRKQLVVLTKHAGYRKKESRRMYRMCLRKYARFPKICEAVRDRYIGYNAVMDELDRLEAEGKIFLIRPREVEIAKMEQNRRKMRAFYEEGYEQMRDRFEEFMEYANT